MNYENLAGWCMLIPALLFILFMCFSTSRQTPDTPAASNKLEEIADTVNQNNKSKGGCLIFGLLLCLLGVLLAVVIVESNGGDFIELIGATRFENPLP